MEENRFFKWVWRINGIAILIAIFAFFWLFYDNEIKDRHHKPKIGEMATYVDEEPKESKEWTLAKNTIKIDGSDYSMLSLISKDRITVNEHVVYYDGMTSGRFAKNILFINRKNSSSTWLFKDNSQLIDSYAIFPNPYPYERNQKVKFTPELIYYKIFSPDEKKKNLAISDISGKNYKVIVKDIGHIISVDKSDKNSVLFIYQKDGVGHSLKFDMDKFETVSDVLLPKVGE